MFLHEDTLHKGTFAHSSCYTQIFCCTGAFAHCKISRAKKMFLQTNVFILRSSSHRSGNNARQKKLRWYRLCIFLSGMRAFFSRDPVQRSHRFSQKIFCRGLSRRSCAYIYRVLAKRPFQRSLKQTLQILKQIP